MRTYSLRVEFENGDDFTDFYTDDFEALEEYETIIDLDNVVFAQVLMQETYGGMLHDEEILATFEREED